ncbi:MAG: hypothetical protein ACXAC7_19145, partial [Candidatus Hodarchaeales archaeon]
MIGLEFEEYISKQRLFWKRIVISGIIFFLLFSFLSYLYFWDLAKKEESEPVFGPSPEPPNFNNIVQKNFFVLVIIPLIGISGVRMGTIIGYDKQIEKPISNLFKLYNITQVKQLTGRINITDSIQLDVKWNNRKRIFTLESDSVVLAY